MRFYAISFFGLLLAGSLGAQPAKTDATPCSVVTKAEVQQAVGGPVSDGTPNPSNKSVCDFKMGAMGSGVGIMLTAKAPGDSAEKTVAALKKSKINAEVVPGLGDGAYASSPGYGMQQLGVYKGTKHVIVTVMIVGAPEAKAKSAAEAIMRKALAKL